LLTDYVHSYLTPYLFDNVRFSDFSSVHSEFYEDPKFENIVFGYGVLLNQQIQSYQKSLEEIEALTQAIDNLIDIK
jgi:hypothetical protein